MHKLIIALTLVIPLAFGSNLAEAKKAKPGIHKVSHKKKQNHKAKTTKSDKKNIKKRQVASDQLPFQVKKSKRKIRHISL